MAEASRHDAWRAGASYDAYMGRWSGRIAPVFLDWLDVPKGLEWLEVGYGTGALSAAILKQCAPKSRVAVDASEGFVAAARTRVPDDRVAFQVGDAEALTPASESRDVIVSALVLNFVPDKEKALAEMKRVARGGGTVGFYVWDYPGDGLEVVSTFWTCAAALDPAALDLAEGRRFPLCTPDGLTALAAASGLAAIECIPIGVPTVFRGFEDY